MAADHVLLRNRFCEITFDRKSGRWSAKDRTADAWAFRDAQFRVLTVACNGWEPQSSDGAVIRKRTGDRGLIDLVFTSDVNARMPFDFRFG